MGRIIGLVLTVGAIYFVVAFSMSRAARRWERSTRRDANLRSLAVPG